MIELLHIDCMEYMKGLKDKAFELAIVDPPYGIGDFIQSAGRKIYKAIKWNDEIPTVEYFAELKRVSKNRIIWGSEYYSKFIEDKGRIVHDKTGGGKRKQLIELSDVDIASHSFSSNMKIFHYLWQGNVQGNTVNWSNNGLDGRMHPCQKPVALYRWLLQKYAKQGDRILDTHLGSGSIAIACHDMGFDLVGCEIDEDYYKAAVKRFKEQTAQLKINY